jgi:glycerol-3-phosphate dehydrogenase (NAD(P)+)
MTLQPLQHLTIIGGGSWATALVKIFSESKISVTWYLRSQEHVDYLLANGRNPNYLGFLQLDLQYIKPTNNIDEALASSKDILFAVPSAYLESEVSELEENALDRKNIYVSIKGIVSDKFLIPSVFLAKRFNVKANDIMVIAGPCHAEEIAMGRKTFLTIAGNDQETVDRMVSAITSEYIKVVANDDPLGVEYAAILKNVIGIACGMVKGMNYGDNFLAVVVSNAMREVNEFLRAVDKRQRDIYDSSYFGDLLVTAYSEYSRNRTFGQMIGRGYSVAMAESRMNMIAEGYPAVKGVQQIAKSLGVKMPVLAAVYRMLYQHAAPYTEFKLLENSLR